MGPNPVIRVLSEKSGSNQNGPNSESGYEGPNIAMKILSEDPDQVETSGSGLGPLIRSEKSGSGKKRPRSAMLKDSE